MLYGLKDPEHNDNDMTDCGECGGAPAVVRVDGGIFPDKDVCAYCFKAYYHRRRIIGRLPTFAEMRAERDAIADYRNLRKDSNGQ